MQVPFPDYEPDASALEADTTDTVINVLPKPGGWGPMKKHAAVATALASAPKGAISVIDSNGDSHIFAGTTTHLYKYNTGTLDWDDVSTAATTYNVPTSDLWDFHQFGDIVLVTNINDGLYYYDLSSSSTFIEVTEAPHAKYVSNVGEYVVLAHISGEPDRVQWSEIGSVTDWTLGDQGSDRQDLPDGGDIRGITFGESRVFIFQANAIREMQYVGGRYVMQFQKITSARGLAAPHSLVEAGNTVFWLDEDGFYMGIDAVPIGDEKVDRTFVETYDQGLLFDVIGAADPVNKIVWWVVPLTTTTNALLGYDWQLKRWTYSNVDSKFIFPAVTPAVTVEGLDQYASSVDDLPYPLDSRFWQGGRPSLAGFDSDYEWGFFEGTNLAATVETADVKLSPENTRSFVNGYRFVTDATNHTGQIAKMDVHGGSKTWDSDTSPTANGLITARANGRLHRFRCEVPADEEWTYIHGVMPMVRQGGRR